ncbi:hypothetical protein L596_009658 [Steinernema carpocapsae]|uniref:Palmitoyltransferase n=1 Tax=Steinernema carpocapsae TaxID=34508 RepID=A0A4U5PGH8_STECR|nr:hypothetical protein L596_009658 [Steinernema carpocapsae]
MDIISRIVQGIRSRVNAFGEKHKRTIYPFFNILGAAYTLTMILGVASINVFHTCPVLWVRRRRLPCRFPIMVAAVMFFQVCSNLFLIHYAMKINKVSYWTKEGSFLLPRSMRPKIQEACQEGAPLPGNPQLGKILLRICDHHCFLTGACLGIGNQRYFVVWLAWICVGAAYSLKYMLTYMYVFMAPESFFDYLSFWATGAFIKWVFGYETTLNLELLDSYVLRLTLSSKAPRCGTITKDSKATEATLRNALSLFSGGAGT